MKSKRKNEVETRLQAAGKPVARDRMVRCESHFPMAGNERQPIPIGRRPNSLSKKILPLLLFAFLIFNFELVCAQSTTVTGTLLDITGQNLSNAKVTFTPNPEVLLQANGLASGPSRTITATNGTFSITLNPDNYVVSLPLVAGRRPFNIVVPPNGGTVNITNLYATPREYAYAFNLFTNQVKVTLGTTTTLPAGETATVSNSGTDLEPILNFGIPQGAAGPQGETGPQGPPGADGSGGGGVSSIWTSSGSTIYPGSSAGADSAWTNTGSIIYPL